MGFFFSSRRRHTRLRRDWSSDVCSSDLMFGAVAGDIQIAVEDDIGETGEPQVVQVHEQEGEIVKHVDGGKGRIEFDGVEQRRPAFNHADVAQVKIAVAVADPAQVPAAVEQRADFVKGFQGLDRKSTRLNSSHVVISYAVFCWKKKKRKEKKR